MKAIRPALAFITCMTLVADLRASTVYQAKRVSIDAVVGDERQANAPKEGYHSPAGKDGVQTTLVGVTGPGATSKRHNQVLIYRYALPTLAPGETISSFTFKFEIAGARGQSKRKFSLDAYLLYVDDATKTGTGLYYRDDEIDINHAFVGSHWVEASEPQANFDPRVRVSFTIDSGDALALLRSYYGSDHIPDQEEACFRFSLNLDRELAITLQLPADPPPHATPA